MTQNTHTHTHDDTDNNYLGLSMEQNKYNHDDDDNDDDVTTRIYLKKIQHKAKAFGGVFYSMWGLVGYGGVFH